MFLARHADNQRKIGRPKEALASYDEAIVEMTAGMAAGAQDVRGDVLVVEGHDVAVLGERVHRLGHGVVTDRRAGHDEGGAGVLGLGEHAERDAELGGRPGTHPSELATSDDADDGESSGSATWGGHPARIATSLG